MVNYSVLLYTVFFKIQNLNEIKYVQNVCDVLVRKFLKSIPKEIRNNFKFYFRYVGNNIYIDFYLLNQPLIKAFLDTGINLSEYDNFYLTLYSSFVVDKLLNICELKELYYDIFSFVFYGKTSRANIDYLFECCQNVLKNHKFNDQKNIELELDAKKIINEVLRITEIFEKEELEKRLEKLFYLKNDLKAFGKELSKTLLSQGLLRFSQVINLDQFSIFLGFPKYKNGIALIFNIQGLTRFVSTFINYIFLFIILEKSKYI